MKEKGFDLVLLSGPENIFYLTGQQTPGYYTFQCLCVPASGEPFHVLRGLEAMNARLNTLPRRHQGYADDAHPAAALAAVAEDDAAGRASVSRIDRNGWFLTVNLYERLIAEFGPLLDGSGLVEPLRRVKSKLEIEQMENAGRRQRCRHARGPRRHARGRVARTTSPPRSWRPRSRPAREYLGMDPFVTSGPRSGVPHTTWRRPQDRAGDVVALETSACYNRYHAALFRTVAIGKIPQLADGHVQDLRRRARSRDREAAARQYLRRRAQCRARP